MMLATLLLTLSCRPNASPGGGTQDQTVLRVDANNITGTISPYIYGSNEDDWDNSGKHLTFGRQGGNRMTAYNWENNASNAGSDYQNQSDNFLGGGDIPGEVPRKAVAAALEHNATFLVTIPMAGYVSADKNGNGDVNKTPNYLETRFKKTLPKKGAPFTYPPNLNDPYVYQDEFVWWLEKKFPNRQPGADIWYSLDNEPALWPSTHSRIHPEKVTFAEMIEKTIATSKAIKAVAPKTLVFGPAAYGWGEYTTLQDAPDRAGRDYLDFYLSSMKEAEAANGKRLLDVLDLHWYPEARGGGKRITEQGSGADLIKARMQATRSLWDPTYVEQSWISDSTGHQPINLIPRMMDKIKKNYPGTKLAFTEYQYGGPNEISGAIAEADALGIFGREGVFAAALWPYGGDVSFVHAAFDAYRNYDGNGARFGDQELKVFSQDPATVSIYASKFSKTPDKIVCVIVNQDSSQRNCTLALAGFKPASSRQFTLTASEAKLMPSTFADTSGARISLRLRAMSVNVLELKQ